MSTYLCNSPSIRRGRPLRNSLRCGAAVLAVAFAALVAGDAFGHSGRTNAAGCHTNRRTGGYHCHTPRTPAPGQTIYCHEIAGERRCGYARSTCNTLVRRFGGVCTRR